MSRVPETLKSNVLGDSEDVFRLAAVPAQFDPAGGEDFPRVALFSASQADADEADRKGWTGGFGLSVWRSNLTTEAQARAFQPGDKPRVAFVANVGAVHGLRAGDVEERLHVVATPLTDQRGKAGWDGHASLFGLPCKLGRFPHTSVAARELRDKLARCFSRM